MFFITGHKNNIADVEAIPFLIPEYLAGTAMHEYFVFPGMGMFGSMSTGRNLENAHAKVSGPVAFSYCNPCGNSLGNFIVDFY